MVTALGYYLQVLILILMEYDLRLNGKMTEEMLDRVLILILMEYDLRLLPIQMVLATILTLNPYSNGI